MSLRKLKRAQKKLLKKGHTQRVTAVVLPPQKRCTPSEPEFNDKEIVQFSAENINGSIEQGNIFRSQGRFTEAIACYQLALNVLPDNADIHCNLGDTFKLQGNLKEALLSYQRAVNVNPEFSQAYCRLANVFTELGELDKAAALYRKGLTLNPDDAEAQFKLGVVFTDMGKLGEAIGCYQQAIAINPNSVDSYYNLGVVFTKEGKPEKAISSYRQALAITPHDSATLFNLGVICKEQGQTDQAISYFEHAIYITPDFAEAFFNLGVLFSEQEKSTEAKVFYQRAMELDPENCSARHLFAAISGKTTQTAPQEHIKKLFDHYSTGFDQHLVKQLSYQVPENLSICLQSVVDSEKRFSNAIDLGCGTGLSGSAFRNISDRLTGIDLSPKMARIAKEKNIYDSIRIGDVVDYLEATEEKFNLFIAADVFIYIGNLEGIFNVIEARSLSHAYFIFSTESTEKDSFILLESGRYAQSRTYIQVLAKKHNFEIEVCQPTNIRKAKDNSVAGELFVLHYMGVKTD